MKCLVVVAYYLRSNPGTYYSWTAKRQQTVKKAWRKRRGGGGTELRVRDDGRASASQGYQLTHTNTWGQLASPVHLLRKVRPPFADCLNKTWYVCVGV